MSYVDNYARFVDARINMIDALADLIFADDRWDHPLTWSDAWNAARVAVDSGWRHQNGRSTDV